MSEVPPSYVHYPRNTAFYGTADQLQGLVDGYYGFSRVFAVNVLGSFLLGLCSGVASSTAGESIGVVITLIGLLAIVVAVGLISYQLAKKIAPGANWPSSRPIVVAVLMGLNSFTCGIVGYVVMQQIVMNHIKKFGIRPGMFGLKVSELARAIAERMVHEQAMPTA